MTQKTCGCLWNSFMKKNIQKKAWSGRFETSSHILLEKFNASLSFDKRLYSEDILGSKIHAEMLCKIGVLTKAEEATLQKGLDEIKKEIETGKFVFSDHLEDIHMAIETRLTEKIGPLGGKLHTARSRNDQVALDLKLYARTQADLLVLKISSLQKAFVDLAEKKGFIPMPGYTHLQRGQPVLLAHHLLAYVEMLERDKSRLRGARRRLNTCPLGSGALAGSPFPLDRHFVAKKLMFDDVTHNSLDAVSDRDFVAELLFDASLVLTHLSRFSEELVLWCTQEFGFVELPEGFCTGSSMMPQKKNPDVPELIRGKTGRVYGALVSILTLLKGLPLAYNKDLQEDKEPFFDAMDTLHNVIDILIAMVPGLNFSEVKMKKALEEGFLLATDVADYLASKKVPFRKAHEISGQIVRYCLEHKTTLEKLKISDYKKFSKVFEKDLGDWLNVKKAVNRRSVVGGPAEARVREEIKRLSALVR